MIKKGYKDSESNSPIYLGQGDKDKAPFSNLKQDKDNKPVVKVNPNYKRK